MKKLVVILLSLVSTGVIAQEGLPARFDFEESDSSSTRIVMHSQLNVNSSAWSQDIINNIAFGNSIEASSIEKSNLRNANKNRLGAFSTIELGVESEIGKNYRVYLGISDRTLAYSSISGDLNQFLMNGNSDFAGDTINADNSFLNIMRFQEFKLGLSKKQGQVTWGIEAALLNGEFLENFVIKTGRLYTEATGSFISYDVDIENWQQDSLQNGFLAPNGIGLNFGAFLKMENDNYSLSFGLSDLGFISWNTESRLTRYVGADTWDPTVVRIGQQSGIQVNINDSIEGIQSFKKESHSTYLPPLLYARLMSFGTQFQHNISASWRLNAAFVPWLQYRFVYQWNEKLSPYVQIGAGGTGRYFTGIGSRVNLGKIKMNLAATNVEGLVLSKQTAGLGGIAQLIIDLK